MAPVSYTISASTASRFHGDSHQLLCGANRQRRLDAGDIGRGCQVRGQKRLEALQVARDHLEQNVDFAVQHIAFEYFGQARDIILERLEVGLGLAAQADNRETGRAPCRERERQYVEITGEAVTIKKNKNTSTT